MPWALLAPALALLTGIVAYPVVKAVWMGFHDLHLLRPQAGRFVGLQNYLDLVADPVFRQSLVNSVVWVVGCVGFQFIGGLAGALILNQPFAGRGLVRGLTLVPWATPSVLVALMWSWMLDGNYGLINDVLRRAGLIDRFVPWLAQPSTALPSVMVADIWQGIPFFAVMLLAALQAIPEELYEAARIDGAGTWAAFWGITLPLLVPTIIITVMLRVMWTANYMDLILIMTGGGPGYSSMTLPLLSYVTGYKRLHVGAGAAVAVMQAAMLAMVLAAYLRLLRKHAR